MTRRRTGVTGFACGITGGSTALIFLGALRDAERATGRASRSIGATSAPSRRTIPIRTTALAEQVLLQPLAGRAPNAVRMEGEAPDLHASAAAYEDRIKTDLGSRSARPAHPRHRRRRPRLFAVSRSRRSGSVGSLRHGDRRFAEAAADALHACRCPSCWHRARVWVVAVGARKLPVLQARRREAGAAADPARPRRAQAQNLTIFTDQERLVRELNGRDQ